MELVIYLNMSILIYYLIFAIGACWGSFLNCLIYRWEQGQKLNQGRSFCPKCRHQLGFWDLVPVLSFIFLRRKCRYCQKPIAWQYLAVEIATGLIFVLIFNFKFLICQEPLASLAVIPSELRNQFLIFNFKNWIELFYYWFVASCLLVIFIYDLKHYIIPDKAVYSAIIVVFLFRILNLFGNLKLEIRNYDPLLNSLLAAVVAFGFFFCIWAISRGRYMGFGDVKLAFLMGLFLGWPNVLLAFFTAFLSGALVGVGLMILGRKKMRSQVPFGPFLIFGAFLAWFWGGPIINWYLNLLWR